MRVIDTIDRRLNRGSKAVRYSLRNWNWDTIGQWFLFFMLAPISFPLLIIGTIAEWRDNRRDGVQTVKG